MKDLLISGTHDPLNVVTIRGQVTRACTQQPAISITQHCKYAYHDA